MPVEPGRSAEPQNEFASLQSCFVEGSGEQRARERRIRRRALFLSVAAQTAILAVIVLLPLFGKPERITLANMIPIPPYAPSHSPARTDPATQPILRHRDLCSRCYSPIFPAHPATTDNTPQDDTPPGIELGDGRQNSSNVWGLLNAGDNRKPEPPPDQPQPPKRVFVTRLEPAMLIQRVEPVYPPLARQIRRGGRVELRAVVATDGTIQSLQVVSGDPLFIQSAMNAVRQWRYRPTVLNGQAVEIDTFITVTYNLVQ